MIFSRCLTVFLVNLGSNMSEPQSLLRSPLELANLSSKWLSSGNMTFFQSSTPQFRYQQAMASRLSFMAWGSRGLDCIFLEGRLRFLWQSLWIVLIEMVFRAGNICPEVRVWPLFRYLFMIWRLLAMTLATLLVPHFLFIIGLPGLTLAWARTLLRMLFRHLKLGPGVLQRDFGLPKLQSCSSLSEEK